MIAPSARNSGETTITMIHAERRYCSTFSYSLPAIVRESAAVSPVDNPTHSAIIRNSNGTASPMAATAASPMVAAYAVSTKVNAALITKEMISGADI